MAENGGAVHLERKLRLRLEPPPPLPTALRRRHSIAAPTAPPPRPRQAPAQSLSFPNGTSASHPPLPPPLDLSGHDFPPTPPSGTSSPSPAASSPRRRRRRAAASPTSAASSSYEISIRNRLVNRAAWAYLRPMSASPRCDGPHLLRRLWLRLSACLGFVRRALGRIASFFLPVRSDR
ncbi:formin-like protein 14 [Eucalyptus grandis]|uniref:formin-like protein 14 n=1 Tax=Eucalyptus grandis TaxID=71139 RepID=UPI00192EA9D6|nr:formin-like protein 14 [Eucalyptus grandis]